MNNNRKFVIFDLDGTLILSRKSIINSLSLAVYRLSKMLPNNEFFLSCNNCDTNVLFESYYKKYCPNIEYERFKRTFDEIYLQYCLSDVSVSMRGIIFLKKVQKFGYSPVLLTNKLQTAAEKICDNLFPKKTFYAIIGRLDSYSIKSQENIIEYLLKCDISADKCIAYVGNSYEDIIASNNIGTQYFDINISYTKDFYNFLKQFCA